MCISKPNVNKDFHISDFKKAFHEYFSKSNPKNDDKPIGPVGDTGWYYLGSGTYTGAGGWKLFTDLIKAEANKNSGIEHY